MKGIARTEKAEHKPVRSLDAMVPENEIKGFVVENPSFFVKESAVEVRVTCVCHNHIIDVKKFWINIANMLYCPQCQEEGDEDCGAFNLTVFRRVKPPKEKPPK